MSMNKRKKTTVIVAAVAAVALLIGGTFAWTSISQQARNEAIVDINPGGRLHDDFNGVNKDVYVENFGDDITGVPIFARVRLDQYFEVGPDAGKNKTDDMENRNVEAKIGTDVDDTSTWITYIPGDLTDTANVQANPNWQWKLGRISTVKEYTGQVVGTENIDLPFVNIYDLYPDGKTGRLTVRKEVVGDHTDPDAVFTFAIDFEGDNAPRR